MVMRLLMDKGDAILCEEYTYPHVAESFVQPQGYAAVPLSMDSHGIVPSLFRQTMESLRAAGKPLPRLLYTVPVGQNPTGQPLPHSHDKILQFRLADWIHHGACEVLEILTDGAGVVTPFERRKEIYALCREYDIILMEDDPYYYLQFSPGGGQPKGLHDLERSYLSMDVDGRVVRMDSFSKVGPCAHCSCKRGCWLVFTCPCNVSRRAN